MSEPITWADVEPAHARLAQALAAADSFLKRRGDLTEQQAFRHSFLALNVGVEDALNHLTLLHNRLVGSEESAPGRPLEAVLADIEAEGHEYTIDSNYGGGGKVRFASKLSEPRWDNAGDWDEEKWARHRAWEQEVEAGAEARLAQIRKLRAAKEQADQDRAVIEVAQAEVDAEARRREAAASEEGSA